MHLDRQSRRAPITASPLPNLALVCVMRPAQDSFNAFLKLVELGALHMTIGALVNVRKAALKKGRGRRAASGPR